MSKVPCARDAPASTPRPRPCAWVTRSSGTSRAKQREDSVRVVAGVFVHREDLEPETEVSQVLGGAANRNADRLFVIPKRQDDRDVEPRAVCHRREK